MDFLEPETKTDRAFRLREARSVSKSKAFMERKLRQLEHKRPLIEKLKKGDITLEHYQKECQRINATVK